MMRRIGQPRGVAMLLVVGVIGIGAVLGYAMLAGASLQTQVSHNSVDSAEADALAESGINLALYYLEHPRSAPPAQVALHPSYLSSLNVVYWTGTGGAVAIPNGPDGTMDVVVTPLGKDLFRIRSTGRAGSGGLSRSLSADVALQSEYQVKHAGAFNQDVVFPLASVIKGDLFSSGRVTISSLLNFTGNVLYGTGVTISDSSRAQQVDPNMFSAPSGMVQVRDYRNYDVNADGVSESATVSSATSILSGTTLGPTAGNPAGIYHYSGNLVLGSNVTVNGTLIVQGTLTVNGKNVVIKQTDSRFPALLVGGDVGMSYPLGSELNVEGLIWVNGRISAGTLNSPRLRVRGALLVAGANPLFAGSTLANVELEYDQTKVNVTDLTERSRTIVGVTVLSWGSAQ